MTDRRRFDSVLLEAYAKVEYSVDQPPSEMENGKYYPITIHGVTLAGHSIDSMLDVSHFLMLQRRIYHKLLDEGEFDGVPSR